MISLVNTPLNTPSLYLVWKTQPAKAVPSREFVPSTVVQLLAGDPLRISNLGNLVGIKGTG